MFPINNKNYIFLKNQSAILNSENYVTNELFRIGGTNNIRGVNEESILATRYSVFNLEYRYRPTLSSYIYTITDYSYIEDNFLNEKTNENHWSIYQEFSFISQPCFHIKK